MKMDQPVDPPLYIKYTPETDTLVLSGVGPVLGSYGDTVARDLVAFTNEAGDEVVGIVLEHAAELLRPYLFPADANDHSQSPKQKVSAKGNVQGDLHPARQGQPYVPTLSGDTIFRREASVERAVSMPVLGLLGEGTF